MTKCSSGHDRASGIEAKLRSPVVECIGGGCNVFVWEETVLPGHLCGEMCQPGPGVAGQELLLLG